MNQNELPSVNPMAIVESNLILEPFEADRVPLVARRMAMAHVLVNALVLFESPFSAITHDINEFYRVRFLEQANLWAQMRESNMYDVLSESLGTPNHASLYFTTLTRNVFLENWLNTLARSKSDDIRLVSQLGVPLSKSLISRRNKQGFNSLGEILTKDPANGVFRFDFDQTQIYQRGLPDRKI